jgi:hypothetical protein
MPHVNFHFLSRRKKKHFSVFFVHNFIFLKPITADQKKQRNIRFLFFANQNTKQQKHQTQTRHPVPSTRPSRKFFLDLIVLKN